MHCGKATRMILDLTKLPQNPFYRIKAMSLQLIHSCSPGRPLGQPGSYLHQEVYDSPDQVARLQNMNPLFMVGALGVSM